MISVTVCLFRVIQQLHCSSIITTAVVVLTNICSQCSCPTCLMMLKVRTNLNNAGIGWVQSCREAPGWQGSVEWPWPCLTSHLEHWLLGCSSQPANAVLKQHESTFTRRPVPDTLVSYQCSSASLILAKYRNFVIINKLPEMLCSRTYL